MIMNIHMKPLQQYYILYAALIFESVDEILWCDNSNETSSGILSLGRTIYFACSSNFWICGWNPMARPFKWNLFSCTLKLYYLFSSNFRVCAQISIPYQIVRLVRQKWKKTAVLPNGEENGHVIIVWCFINTLSIAFYYYLFMKKNCGHSKRHAWRRHAYIGDG